MSRIFPRVGFGREQLLAIAATDHDVAAVAVRSQALEWALRKGYKVLIVTPEAFRRDEELAWDAGREAY